MRMPLPRAIFILTFICLSISGFGLYLTWQELSSKGIAWNGKADADVVMVVLSLFFLSGLSLLFRCLTHEYSCWVWGETFSDNFELSSGKSFCVRPLSGLSGKLLIVKLWCNLPEELQQKIRPLNFYRSLPPVPYARYTVALFGEADGQQIQIAKRVLVQKLESIWGANNQDNEKDDRTIEFAVQQPFTCYSLQVKAEMGYKKSATDDSFKTVSSEPILNIASLRIDATLVE